MEAVNLNGARVISVTQTEWREADQSRLIDGARIVGRAVVQVAGGGLFNGLVVRRRWFEASTDDMLERAWVVVWERDGTPGGAFRALPLSTVDPG